MGAAKRVMVVEDEIEISHILRDYLIADGFDAKVINSGGKIVESVRNDPPDLLLLDWMLPEADGLTICREIRAFSNIPIIIITAKTDEVDCLLGLHTGADDYIGKPVKPREVVARVKSVLRRVGVKNSISTGPLQLQVEQHGAAWNGKKIELTPVEFRLLALLARDAQRVYSREVMMSVIYDDGRYVTDRTIDTHVKNLRKKLAEVSGIKNPIRPVYGVGYKLDLDVASKH